jgi:hypothetical protein
MKKLLLGLTVVLLAGCGDRKGGEGREAVFGGQTTSYWIQQLKNKDQEKKKEAIRILVQNSVKDKTIMDDLMTAVKGDDNELRRGVCEVFGAMGWDAPEEAFSTLETMLRDNDSKVAVAAGAAMRQINPKKAAAAGVGAPPPEKH